MVRGLANWVLCGPNSATTCSEPCGSTGRRMVNIVTLSTAPAGTMIVKPTKSTRPPSGPIHAFAQAMVTCGLTLKRANCITASPGAAKSVVVLVVDTPPRESAAPGAGDRGATGVLASVHPTESETTVAATARSAFRNLTLIKTSEVGCKRRTEPRSAGFVPRRGALTGG